MNPALQSAGAGHISASMVVAVSLALGCLTMAPPDARAANPLSQATADLQAGKADEATALLDGVLKSDPDNAQADNLLCRVQYALQQFDPAVERCQKAVDLSPQNSEYRLWLARATGEKASRANFVSAFSLARTAREQFETSVQLDPRNTEALSDLGEFYEEAPGMVGGGIDKAEAIAQKLSALDPARAHQLRAEIALKQKDPAAAEREFKAACTGPRAAVQWVELANFYRKQQRWTEMDAAIQSGEAAEAHDSKAAVALFNAAATLARANRNPQEAIRLYRSYLASPNKTEEAPAFDALTRLAKLDSQAGDRRAAQRDRAEALALAHDYKPAQDLKL